MRKIIFSLIVFSLTAVTAVGQSVNSLNQPADARYFGMGNTGYGLTSTPFAANYNPAAILLSGDRASVGASFNMWQPKMGNSKLYSLGGYYNINSKVGVMASVNYASHNKITLGLDDTFRPSEYSINAGVAYRFYKNLSLGVSLKYIGSDIGAPSKGSAFAADIALMYKYKDFNFTVGASNLGSKIDYGYDKYELPARLRAGVSYQVELAQKHSLTAAAEFAYYMQPSVNKQATSSTGYIDVGRIGGGVGVEYNYNKLISLRGGYNDRETGPSYGTVGVGVYYSGVTFDFSYAIAGKDSPMKNTMIFALGWRL